MSGRASLMSRPILRMTPMCSSLLRSEYFSSRPFRPPCDDLYVSRLAFDSTTINRFVSLSWAGIGVCCSATSCGSSGGGHDWVPASHGWLLISALGTAEMRDGKEEGHWLCGKDLEERQKDREQKAAVKCGTADRRKRHAVRESNRNLQKSIQHLLGLFLLPDFSVEFDMILQYSSARIQRGFVAAETGWVTEFFSLVGALKHKKMSGRGVFEDAVARTVLQLKRRRQQDETAIERPKEGRS